MYVGLPVLLYQRTTEVYLGPQLSRRISHATLRNTWDVSNSRAVVRMHNIHIWPVVLIMHARMHKLLIRKTVRRVWSHYSSIVSFIHLYARNNRWVVDPNTHCNLFLIWNFACNYTHNSKTTGRIWTLYGLNDWFTIKDIYFLYLW